MQIFVPGVLLSKKITESGSLFVQYSDTQLQDLVTVTVTVFRILTLVTVKSVLQDLQ